MFSKKQENLISRPPVVVVLGHVDHGKSSLLESIKDFKITSEESGGITQHIGAYEVELKGKKITFIDTPGHEAFSAMRSRGARVADIAVLVIAAEEGLKPQTKEAILHIKKSQIPMIVALNKMDRPEANPEKVKRELAKEEVLVESMGGKIPSVEVSAKTKKGVPELLEVILLVAEMEDLKADISAPAQGVVIESHLDSKRGPTATVITQAGILKEGDVVGTSLAVGRIKNLENFQGNPLKESLPSAPVVTVGFEEAPGIGENFKVFGSIEKARENVKGFSGAGPEVISVGADQRVVNVILKVDVAGSLEAILEILKELPQGKVILRILKAEAGNVNESDVKLASGAKAKILAFRVKTHSIASHLAQRDKVAIINFEVIYELVQAARAILEKSVASEEVRVDLGKVKILEIFLEEKNKKIIGGKVTEGKIRKGAKFEIFRNEEKVGEGRISGLQKNKKEAGEVEKSSECGILYSGETKIETGDILAVYVQERIKGEL